MKKTKTKFFFLALVAIMLMLPFGSSILFSYSSAFANNPSTISISGGPFDIDISPQSRDGSYIATEEQTVTNSLGKDITYLVYDWETLQTLDFAVTSNLFMTSQEVTNFSMLVTHIQTNDLTKPVSAENSATKTLIDSTIVENTFHTTNLYFHIDQNSSVNESGTVKKGNDFGIYKFDFTYTYLNDTTDPKTPVTVSLGEVYVAVLSKDIEDVSNTHSNILYSISSSNKLLNVFNLTLSNKDLSFVDPALIEWNVIGSDKQNQDYVLTQERKDQDINYINYQTIWHSLPSTTGTSFLFDSNDIEGTWTVIVNIRDTDGIIIETLTLENLSTIKNPETINVFLIVGITFGVLAAIGITILIIWKTKKDKVW